MTRDEVAVRLRVFLSSVLHCDMSPSGCCYCCLKPPVQLGLTAGLDAVSKRTLRKFEYLTGILWGNPAFWGIRPRNNDLGTNIEDPSARGPNVLGGLRPPQNTKLCCEFFRAGFLSSDRRQYFWSALWDLGMPISNVTYCYQNRREISSTHFTNINWMFVTDTATFHAPLQRYCCTLWTQLYNFNCCFTVHSDKYKTILPTNAPFIKT